MFVESVASGRREVRARSLIDEMPSDRFERCGLIKSGTERLKDFRIHCWGVWMAELDACGSFAVYRPCMTGGVFLPSSTNQADFPFVYRQL